MNRATFLMFDAGYWIFDIRCSILDTGCSISDILDNWLSTKAKLLCAVGVEGEPNRLHLGFRDIQI